MAAHKLGGQPETRRARAPILSPSPPPKINSPQHLTQVSTHHRPPVSCMADLHRLLDGSPTTDPASLSRSRPQSDQDYFSSPPTQHTSLPSEQDSVRVGSSLLDVSMGPSLSGSSSLGLDCSLGPLDGQPGGDQSINPAQFEHWQAELNNDRNPLASSSNVSTLVFNTAGWARALLRLISEWLVECDI